MASNNINDPFTIFFNLESGRIGNQLEIAESIVRTLGNAYLILGEYQKAIECYEKGLEISTAIGDRPGIASNTRNLGNAYRRLEEYQKAIEYYEKSLEISTAIGDRSGIASDNSKLGNAYQCLGEYQKAIKCCEKGLEICTAIGDRSGIASHTGNLGVVYNCLGEYQKAIEYHEKGLEISTAIGDRSGIASKKGNLGNAYLGLGEYPKAIECYEKALEISTAIGDRSGIATNTGNLGNAYKCSGEYQKAIEYYEKGLEISTVIGDRSGIASNTGNLGTAYRSLGEYQKAIEHYEKSLEISTAISDQSGIATRTCNLGTAYHFLGEYQKAIEYYEKGLEISTAIGDRLGIASNYGNMGNAYQLLGEYQKAIEHYEKGLEISTAIGDRSGIASKTGNLGNAYFRLGEYQKAIEHYEKGLEISTAIGDRSGVASKTGNLGNAYLSLGEYQKAIEYYEKGLEINTAIGNRSGIAENTGNLGNAYQCLGEYQKAIEYYEKSLEISTANGCRSTIALSTGNLGNLYSSLGEYPKAIEYYKKSLEISTAIGDRSVIAGVSAYLGHAYQSLGEHQDALLNLMKSIRLFDRIFLHMVPDENKLAFRKQYVFAHIVSMTCFLSLERTESALLVNDLGRCKELHFCVDKHKKIVDEEVVEYAHATLNRIEARDEQMEIQEIQKILDRGRNDTSILVFAFDLEDFLHIWVLNHEYIYLKSEACLETTMPLIVELLGRENVNVNRDSVFFKSDSVATTNGQMIVPPEMPDQKHGPNTVLGNTADYCNYSSREILIKLFKLLIAPVKDHIQGNKLIVVPDKQLFFIPFSCLVDENGCYLSHSYSIQITPSLHSLKCSVERSYASNFGYALFVGNPTVRKTSLNEGDSARYDLPGATEEVRYLSKLFLATPLLGDNATKQVVLQLLSGASIIHIAAHGDPNQGEIMLATNSSQIRASCSVSKPDSYLLTQKDIKNIPLQARLVVLCCCYTGQGELSSEGVIGITRAFLAAGARSVLAALWPIHDDATKVFMEKFYGELCKDTSVCEALRRTMNVFQKHEKEEYRSSRIWAPFTIYGEDVKFRRDEIEKIRERSREMFAGFVVLPNDLTNTA